MPIRSTLLSVTVLAMSGIAYAGAGQVVQTPAGQQTVVLSGGNGYVANAAPANTAPYQSVQRQYVAAAPRQHMVQQHPAPSHAAHSYTVQPQALGQNQNMVISGAAQQGIIGFAKVPVPSTSCAPAHYTAGHYTSGQAVTNQADICPPITNQLHGQSRIVRQTAPVRQTTTTRVVARPAQTQQVVRRVVQQPTRTVVQQPARVARPAPTQTVNYQYMPVYGAVQRQPAPQPQQPVVVNVAAAAAPAPAPAMNFSGFGGGIGGGINTAPPGGGNFSSGRRGYGSVFNHPAARLAFRPEAPTINISNDTKVRNHVTSESNSQSDSYASSESKAINHDNDVINVRTPDINVAAPIVHNHNNVAAPIVNNHNNVSAPNVNVDVQQPNVTVNQAPITINQGDVNVNPSDVNVNIKTPPPVIAPVTTIPVPVPVPASPSVPCNTGNCGGPTMPTTPPSNCGPNGCYGVSSH